MKNTVMVWLCVLALMPSLAAAQTGQGSGIGSGSGNNDQATTSSSSSTTQKDGKTTITTARVEDAQPNPRFVRTLTNVQIELTLTDQSGSNTPEKKSVSMVVSSGNWGKIRSSGSMRQVGDAPVGVDLNVDARPFVSVEGPIQLELTLNYSPGGLTVPGKDNATAQTGLNQSLTVVLQTGKPLIISQSADPVSDRKVVVEVKATVLK